MARVFLRVRCTQCHAERLVAFSCKRRGFCPSCAARRITESAALLVDEVLPREPLRQWVLSVPFPLRYLFATDPVAMGAVLGIVYRAIASHLVRKSALTHASARTGSLQTLAPALELPSGEQRLAEHSGFSLHAGVAAVPPARQG